jgi:hypothetical protein
MGWQDFASLLQGGHHCCSCLLMTQSLNSSTGHIYGFGIDLPECVVLMNRRQPGRTGHPCHSKQPRLQLVELATLSSSRFPSSRSRKISFIYFSLVEWTTFAHSCGGSVGLSSRSSRSLSAFIQWFGRRKTLLSIINQSLFK